MNSALGPGGCLLELVGSGERLVESLAAPAVVRSYARALLAAWEAVPGASLRGASAPAERLVGAALALSDGEAAAPAGAAVVLCDIVVASGASLADAAASARRAGAGRVFAAVLRDARPAGSVLPQGVDGLVVLEPGPDARAGSRAALAVAL